MNAPKRRSTIAWIAAAGLVVGVGIAVAVVASVGRPEPRSPAAVRFAVLADVQYADAPARGSRDYRGALPRLQRAVDALADEPDLTFVVQLGDLIEGRERVDASRMDLDRVLSAFAGLDAPVEHVIGNHCLAVPRSELQERLELASSYRSLRATGYRFVFLDTMLETTAPSAWNGSLGAEQRAWLVSELEEAERAGERALLFAHHPLLEETGSEELLAEDHAEILEILDASPAAAAWFHGHVHRDAHAERNGVHHIGVAGIVEAPPEGAWGVVELRGDVLEVEGHGSVRSRRLSL